MVLDEVRFMRDVNLVTSARVYVVNDMVQKLLSRLYNEVLASHLQHGIEYYPTPSFTATALPSNRLSSHPPLTFPD